MRFHSELRRQRKLARRKLTEARAQGDDLLADAMVVRLDDLRKIASQNAASVPAS
jgi:hypothetical protein